MTMLGTAARKYRVGSKVKINPTIRGLPLDKSSYEVTHLLPAENNDFQYRLRSADGRVQRVAFESQLV
jgi:hypothetical protein